MADLKLAVIISAIDQASDTLRGIAGSTDALGTKFKTAGLAAGVAGGAIMGGIFAAAGAAREYGESVDKAVKMSGVGAEAFQRLAYAAEQEHASMGAVQMGMARLSRVMNAANTGSKEAQATFTGMGIAFRDSSGALRPLQDVMLQISDRFAAMPAGAEKTALAMQIFGRAGFELVPFLSQGSAEIARLGDEAQRIGRVMSGEAVVAAEAYGDAMTKWRMAMGDITMQIGSAFIPVLLPMVDAIGNIVGQVGAWIQQHPVLAAEIGKIILALGVFLSTAAPVLIILGQTTIAMQTLWGVAVSGKAILTGLSLSANAAGASMAWTLGPIALVAAAVTGLAIELWYLKRAWDSMREAQEQAAARQAETAGLFAGVGATGAGAGEAIGLGARPAGGWAAAMAGQRGSATVARGGNYSTTIRLRTDNPVDIYNMAAVR